MPLGTQHRFSCMLGTIPLSYNPGTLFTFHVRQGTKKPRLCPGTYSVHPGLALTLGWDERPAQTGLVWLSFKLP